MSNAHDTLLGLVPPRLVDTAQFVVTAYEGRITEFNLAVWLRVPGLAHLPVSLIVSYRDGGKRHEVQVDHGKVSAQDKIMLSGVARLPTRLKLEDVEVRLRSALPATSLVVEELFVQAVEVAGDASRHGSA